jgi:hypothetical protein
MELWLRFRRAERLQADAIVDVSSPEEWRGIVRERRPISSILWLKPPLFRPSAAPGSVCFVRRHPHEKNCVNDPERNNSYRQAAMRLASSLRDAIGAEKTLVYAPLRGAWPIWKAVGQFLPDLKLEAYHPVTSSFVFHSAESGIVNRQGRPASGRFNHILELQRLRPILREYSCLIYLDEIVSGGMMAGYLRDMIGLGLNREVKLVACGLADDFGRRSEFERRLIAGLKDEGRIADFLWEGCASLITQDQKFLLGIHYLDYHDGLNIVPVLNDRMEYYDEYRAFESEVMAGARQAERRTP